MDRLEEIFALQSSLNEEIRRTRGLRMEGPEWIQKETLAMLSEMAELLDEVHFKWWKNPSPIDGVRVKEELVDILHFFVSMCLDAGLTAEELHRMYIEKHQENLDRQHGLSAKPGYAVDELEPNGGNAQ